MDEAIAADATEVRFSQPVYLHVDNFLGAPVGAAVPLGYYDRQRGYWVPAPDGRVIEVLGVSGGLALVDVDGDGNADDASAVALGIDEAERRALAGRYPDGGSLWRSPIPHFTPWDCNWPYVLPDDAEYPESGGDGELDAEGRKHPCRESGSVLSCESQTLGEKIPLPGTPLSLVYSSARAMGRLSREGLNIPLTGGSLPASVRAVVAEAEIGGRLLRETFAPAPDLVWRVEWDRKDAFGREVSGLTWVRGRIGYVYEVTYAALGASSSGGSSFNAPVPAGSSFSRSEDLTATLWSPFARLLDAGGSGLDARTVGLGGFTLDEHHIYDPRRHGVAGGDGIEYAAPVDEGTRARVIIAVGGRPNGRDPNIPGSVLDANLASPAELAPHPDGGYWLVTGGSRPLRRVDARGNLTTVGCTEAELAEGSCLPPEDGQPAAGRDITSWGFTVGSAPDGSVFYVSEDYRIWRIDAAGILHWVAGSGSDSPEPLLGQVGGSARDYAIDPSSLRFDPSGGYLYFVHGDAEVYRVSPDGRLEHVAGLEDGSYSFSGEGGPATQATFRNIQDLALDTNGELYLAHDGFNRANGVYRVGRDGVLVRHAGRGVSDPDCGSEISEGGVNRRDLCFGQGGVRGIAFAPDGALMAMSAAGRLYRLSEPAQVVARSAISTGAQPDFASAFQEVEFRPHMIATAGGAFLVLVRDRIYDLVGLRVLRNINADDIFVPSPDAREAWVFSPEGRHLSTHEMRTGAVLWMMGYGPHGLLETVTDAQGNVTTIERDASGAPTAIVAPAGQRTALSLDTHGYLTSVETPDARVFSIDWAGPADGQPEASDLMRSFTLPSGATSSFTYDEVGRLVS